MNKYSSEYRHEILVKTKCFVYDFCGLRAIPSMCVFSILNTTFNNISAMLWLFGNCCNR